MASLVYKFHHGTRVSPTRRLLIDRARCVNIEWGAPRLSGAPMQIESSAILNVGVMFVVALAFCKTLEIVVERARKLFLSTNDCDPIKMELNALNIKIDALRVKFDGKLEVLKTENRALKNEIDELKNKTESTAPEQFSIMPNSPSSIPEDAYKQSEDTWIRDMRVCEASTVPTIPSSTSDDTWTRNAAEDEIVEGGANTGKKVHSLKLQKPMSLQPRTVPSSRQWELPKVLID